LDINPNSNGYRSHEAVSRQPHFGINNFSNVTYPSKKDKGTVYSRHIKKFSNCVNACHSKEQETILNRCLLDAFEKILEVDGNKKQPPMQNCEDSKSATSTNSRIASLPSVETAPSYKRKAPIGSPTKFKN
jgi:hypothetical protein